MLVAIPLALMAALSFAAAAILQQRSARAAPEGESMSPRLILDLVRRPVWIAGFAVGMGSYGLQAAALAYGSVGVVQPIIVTELVFALPFAIRSKGARLGLRELGGAASTAAGVALFLLSASPTGGRPMPSTDVWLVVLGAGGAAIAAVIAVARGPESPRRAALLAAGAGISFALMSVLTKTTMYLLGRGILNMLLHWQPYALAVVAPLGFLLAQSAFQAGPLAISLPIIDSLEPSVAVLIGTLAFGEHFALAPLRAAGESVGAVAALAGVFLLGRSPAVLAIYERTEKSKREAGTAG
ncbi:MAG: DMT family transporter [Actinomycetota bacterium]|nr:DMT family transporter [Actinomycetota bacterium]